MAEIIQAKTGQKYLVKGVQGRRQFLNGRKKLLDAYDAARTESKAHEIEVHHGKVAEAQFRRWLVSFLPKKYGVTPGYIISQAASEEQKLPHYDVVIYDRMESPVLWIEESPDSSTAGSSRAIPAEYVRGVIEVKSSFSTANVGRALDHLTDLDPLLADIDDSGSRYPKYLPANFFRSVVFVELRSTNRFETSGLKHFLRTVGERGYFDSLILRGEDLDGDYAGRIQVLHSTNVPPQQFGPAGRDLLQGFAISECEFMNETYFGTQIIFSQNEFSHYAFDILGLLGGTYEGGRLSSFHASSLVEIVLTEEKP